MEWFSGNAAGQSGTNGGAGPVLGALQASPAVRAALAGRIT